MFIHTIDRLHNYSIILTRSEQKKNKSTERYIYKTTRVC